MNENIPDALQCCICRVTVIWYTVYINIQLVEIAYVYHTSFYPFLSPIEELFSPPIRYTQECLRAHNFCHSCIDRYIAHHGHRWSCPFCRHDQTGSASDLPRDNDLEVIVNFVRNLREENQNPVPIDEQSCFDKMKNISANDWKAIIGSFICLGPVLYL